MRPTFSNSPSDTMNLEKDLNDLAAQYVDEGYTVQIHPSCDQLPPFARDFNVAIVARRGNEGVLVQVKKDRSDLEADAEVSKQADITHAQPHWRYDLVVLYAADPNRRALRGARGLAFEQIEQMLMEAETAAEHDAPRAGFVLAWAALEAAMRRVSGTARNGEQYTTAMELVRVLYSEGTLTRFEFDALSRNHGLRSEIVHGFVTPPVGAANVAGVVALARRLLAVAGSDHAGTMESPARAVGMDATKEHEAGSKEQHQLRRREQDQVPVPASSSPLLLAHPDNA